MSKVRIEDQPVWEVRCWLEGLNQGEFSKVRFNEVDYTDADEVFREVISCGDVESSKVAVNGVLIKHNDGSYSNIGIIIKFKDGSYNEIGIVKEYNATYMFTARRLKDRNIIAMGFCNDSSDARRQLKGMKSLSQDDLVYSDIVLNETPEKVKKMMLKDIFTK